MAIVFIGIGSNEGDSMQILQDALLDLKKNLGIYLKSSSVYETEPIGFDSSNLFLNAVLKFETTHLPAEVLNMLLYIENKAGRKRTEGVRHADRTLDLDLLYYDDLLVDEVNLNIPHPRISERKFVLEPLSEIDPDWFDVRTQQTAREMLIFTNDHSATKIVTTRLI